MRIGTRGSALALWQAEAVAASLRERYPTVAIDLEIIKPEGDIDKQSSLLRIGGRGVFASALQEAVLHQQVDMAVHCSKDVPTISPQGLVLASYPQREDARDAVVSRHGVGLSDLPANPIIGTSSRRRAVQVLAIRPDATIAELRGNIDTRLRKAASDEYDAVILAAAGLTRMGWNDRITEYLSYDAFVPAPGQGALVIETRRDSVAIRNMAESLNDPAMAYAVQVERAFLRAMGGGCTTPVGAHAVIDGDQVHLWAMLASDDGERLVRTQESLSTSTAIDDAERIGRRMLAETSQRWPGVDLAGESPLSGKTILVTGTGDFVARTGAAFTAAGATVEDAPTVEILPTATPGVLQAALKDAAAGAFDWVVVTSTNTVSALAAYGADALAENTRFAVVGDATATALRNLGLTVELVPEDQTGPGLARSLTEVVPPGARVLCLLGSRAGDTITSPLRRNDVNVVRVESYRSITRLGRASEVRSVVRGGRLDGAVFASPSSVQVLTSELGVDIAALSGACLVAIGETTAAAMREAGLPVHATASHPSPEGVLAVTGEYFSGVIGTTGEPAS